MKHALVSAAAVACLLLSAQLAPAIPNPAPAPAAAGIFAVDFAAPAPGQAPACPAIATAAESPLPAPGIGFVCGRLQCTPCIQQHLRCVPSGNQCLCEK